MKRRIVLFQCCVVLSVLLTGCQLVSDREKEEIESEIVTEVMTERTSEEEEYKQCPYCAHWFGTMEGENGSPYDIHMEEERATDSTYGLTEAELVECTDCGNWYPVGNIFRNHICEGRP